ncbi:hypothetical protein GCM10028803_23900 [Larkinella knui]|uniref:DUF5723 domain-containing protein n=1 Tax=Larkinella knui TaxID=2025310 RepID=A0A3P1CVW4_9BACT|nr:DUF5723 family protein [Larkinella knui]RRB17455.1 hypothetical protein EHT87_03985 [Larkinella knui]
MRERYGRLFATLAILSFSFPTWGQYLTGIANSNYGGTQSIYRHPSEAADSRYRVYLNLATVDFYASNNYVRWVAPFSVVRYMTGQIPSEYRSERGKSLGRTGYLKEQLNGRDKRLTLGGEIRGPSALVTLNDRFGVALSTRVRTGISYRNTSEETARLMLYGTQIVELQRILNENQHGMANVNGYAELAATFGAVLLDNDEQFWKAGVTIKREVGFYNAHVRVDDGTHQIVRDPNQSGFQALRIRKFDGVYGYTNQTAFQNAGLAPGWLFGKQSAGGGWGFDLGMTYEYRPAIRSYTYRENGELRRDPTKNKYLYRISASLVDIGGIRFKNPEMVNLYQVSAVNKLITNTTFLGVKEPDEINNRIVDVLDLPLMNRTTSYRSGLPTALNVSADYQFRPQVYVGVLWTQSLVPSNAVAMITPSMLAVVPRWESRWAEVSMPIALQDNYSMPTIGLAMRVGPVFAGTDHLGGLANIGNPRGANFYAGATIPLFRRGPKNPNACYFPPQEGGYWKRFGRKR